MLSTTLLANVLELGTVTHRQIAALADVAPLNRDCGTLHGKRMVGGERAQVRATHYNPAIKTCYQRLCGLGKTKEEALSACMRKLLTTLNATFEHRTRWRTERLNRHDSQDSC